MSEEFKIPLDLAILESKLRSVPVAKSGIDREETLYQAGWAAAMASAMPAQTAAVPWFWPATSSVLATVAAVLAIVVYQQRMDVPNRLDSTAVATAPDLKLLNKHQDAIDVDANHSLAESRWMYTDLESRIANAPLTASSYRLDFPEERVPVFDNAWETVTPKSTFELLREMVPRTDAKTKTRIEESKPIWDWFSQKVGEII